MSATGDDSNRRCPWCSVLVTTDPTHCPACGAALAQRESIGDLVIPGVTHVDPGLKSYAAQPLRIPGNSPSQYVAGPAAGAAAMGGPEGLLALGGLAVVAASEYLGASRTDAEKAAALEKLGQPSEAVLQMLQRLEEETEPGAASSSPTEAPSEGDGTPSS